MTDEDRALAAQRLLTEPMLIEALAKVERDAVEAMMMAQTDQDLREGRDTVKTVRSIVSKLQQAIVAVQEAKRPRLGVV